MNTPENPSSEKIKFSPELRDKLLSLLAGENKFGPIGNDQDGYLIVELITEEDHIERAYITLQTILGTRRTKDRSAIYYLVRERSLRVQVNNVFDGSGLVSRYYEEVCYADQDGYEIEEPDDNSEEPDEEISEAIEAARYKQEEQASSFTHDKLTELLDDLGNFG